MKFISLNGRVDEDSSYISITIEGGDNSNSIGDQMWISNDGTQLEITDMADEDVLEETSKLFQGDRLAFRGAMRRMGVTW